MPRIGLKPYWQTPDGETVKLYLGNVTDVLDRMPAQSVQTCITSPPYWNLRSYLPSDHADKGHEIGSEPLPDCNTFGQAQCGKCFACEMVNVFRSVMRVLRDDGTCFINLGDSYSSGSRATRNPCSTNGFGKHDYKENPNTNGRASCDIPAGNLCGIPWRVALALQADGWVLRSDMPWLKRSAMPESVRNRPAKALEYVFLLTKQGSGYYYDGDAIRKASSEDSGWAKQRARGEDTWKYNDTPERLESTGQSVEASTFGTAGSRNFRNADLWFESIESPHGMVRFGDEVVGLDVTSEAYSGAHFACFGRKLITPFVLAGTSEKGCCPDCGSPWRRITESEKLTRDRPRDYVKRTGENGTGNSCSNSVAGVDVKTVGWQPTCSCGRSESECVPCVALDPFCGTATTCCVAVELGRYGWGIDLSEKYLRENAVPRIEGSLFSIPALRGQVKRDVKRVDVGRVL